MKKLVLGSASPRRAFLLNECGFRFDIRPSHADEGFDPATDPHELPVLLASRKWMEGSMTLKDNECLITADTVVILGKRILNKPSDEQEAIRMLTELSGKTHTVITGVCIGQAGPKPYTTSIRTAVTFHDLPQDKIAEYVKVFRPLDKAGAYGAQECLVPDANPCSPGEQDFIARLGLGEIIARSKPPNWKAAPLTAIRRIDGPYFNVMGLPIAEIYDELKRLLAL